MPKSQIRPTLLSVIFLPPRSPGWVRAEEHALPLVSRRASAPLGFLLSLPKKKASSRAKDLNAVVVIMQNQVVVNGVVGAASRLRRDFLELRRRGALAGLPVRIVMSVMDGSDHYLVTGPNIKRVEDLKGKKFGISSFGGTPHSEAIMILRKVRYESGEGRHLSADRRQLRALHAPWTAAPSTPPCSCRPSTSSRTSAVSTSFFRSTKS